MPTCRFDFPQGFIGLGMIVVFLFILCNSIAFTPSCNWGDETPVACQRNVSGKIEQLTKIVALTYCYEIPFADAFSFWNPYQIGLPVNWSPNDMCRRYDCKGGCLKVTSPCVDGNPDTTQSVAECVSSKNGQDMRPLAVFVYPPFIILGFILMIITKDLSEAQLCAILILAFAVFNFERSVNIVRGCPWSQETYSQCGSGKNKEVKNDKTIELSLCTQSTFFEHTPFATNIQNSPDCLYRGCSTSQCLKRTTVCPNEYGETFECVDQVSEASAAPVTLFFSLGLVILSIIVCCIGLRGGGEHRRLVE